MLPYGPEWRYVSNGAMPAMALRQQWCYASNGATSAMALPQQWRNEYLKKKKIVLVTLPEVIIMVQQSVLIFQNRLKS